MERLCSHSRVFMVEELECRRHLAATPFSAYWPMLPGSRWVYDGTDNGKATTETVVISGPGRMFNGQKVFERLERSSNESGRTITLENVGAGGAIQTYRIKGNN